jgi:hypothetical protein
MASLHVDDVSCVPMPVMEFEFIDAEILCLPFRFNEFLAVNGVFLLKPLFVDILDDILSQPGNLSNLFIRISLECQQITGILIKGFRNQVTWGFEADELFLDGSAAIAPKLNMRKSQATQITAKAEVPECDFRTTIDMHPLSAFTPAFTFQQVKVSLKAVNGPSGCCFPYDGFRVMEAKQTRRDLEEF